MADDNEYYRLRRLMISGQDFAIAKSAALFLIEAIDDEGPRYLADLRRMRCYETTMVIAYARPFSQAKGKIGRLTKADVGLTEDHAFLPLHGKLISHRNQLYGHSDGDHVEMSVLSFVPLGDRADIELNIPRFEERLRFSSEEVDEFFEEVSVILSRILKEIWDNVPKFKNRLQADKLLRRFED